MAISDSLTIKQISNIKNKFCFDCIGSIDAHADKPLQILRDLPADIHVVLDFNNIERVNSMGLSLLLKIFEDWEKDSTKIEILNLNRMVNMLFKITGLGRFIKGNEKTSSESTGRKIISPTAPAHSRLASSNDKDSLVDDGKLNFVASLHSTHQLSGWYLFNTYLQRKMQRAIHFEQFQDVKNNSFHLFFAKPFDACMMMNKKSFIPLVRPSNDADEVVILTRADESRELIDFKGTQTSVVSADQGSFVYLLGRFLCDESGLESADFKYDFAGNEIKAIQMLIRKKADVAFILKKTYEGLSSFSRKNVRQIDESITDFAFHQFCIAPSLKSQKEDVLELLMGMEKDEKGKQILTDIQLNGWVKPEEGELNMLKMVYERYVLE